MLLSATMLLSINLFVMRTIPVKYFYPIYLRDVVNKTGFLRAPFGPVLKSSLTVQYSIVDTGFTVTDFRWGGSETAMLCGVVGKSGQLDWCMVTCFASRSSGGAMTTYRTDGINSIIGINSYKKLLGKIQNWSLSLMLYTRVWEKFEFAF